MREMTTREVQQVSLDILKDVHEFCVKNNIKYSLSGGTLLGAIRHNGFIPWDDDVDIQMPRPDYDRFIHTYVSQRGYKVYSRELPELEKKNITYAHGCRVCDMERTFVDTGLKPWITEDTGIWIDVFPCDGISSDFMEAKKHLGRVHELVRHARWLVYKDFPWKKMTKRMRFEDKVKCIIKKLISGIVPTNTFDKMLALKKKYDYTTSDYFFATTLKGLGEWQPKKNMENFELHQFEYAEFYIMSGYDANLTSLYGNYMQLPPENKRTVHRFNKYYWK